MIRRDYIIRVIEQFGAVWSQIVAQIGNGLLPTARGTLDRAYADMLGLDGDALRALRPAEIIARLRLSAAPEVANDRALVIAALFKGEGDLALASDDHEIGIWHYARALELLLAATAENPDAPLPEHIPTVDALVALLTDYHLPFAAQRMLLERYEQQHDFARAEDALFELLQREETRRSALEIADRFYARLAALDDTELARGNFSRAEIAAGIAAARAAR